jgi:glutamyl-tRNA(Gln) amidotransferase subunit E
MFDATPINETHVMRKVVIDGSTTFGFQRTAVIALNGMLKVGEKNIPLQTICLEEDACRKIKEESLTGYYRLDRLGIPLIEVVTEPVITSPEEAGNVALAIGRTLKATGKVKRGLGTIRQDVNISIRDGALIEVKGVQDLGLLPQVIKSEVQRQLTLLKIVKKLANRGIKEEDFTHNFKNVEKIFTKTKCHVISTALKQGHTVLAAVLPKFSNILGMELTSGLRFGTELSDYAKFWGRVGGIFHTDELPAYGITEDEVMELKSFLKISDTDAIVLVADTSENVYDALNAVLNRAKQALTYVPSETRGALPDGITHYLRPRPGAARMYPETDVPPVPITPDHLKRIKATLPESPEVRLSYLMKKYALNKKLAAQVLISDYSEVFETIASTTGISPSFIAATLTETFKNMQRDGMAVNNLSEEIIHDLFSVIDSGNVTKEAIPQLLVWMVKHENASLDDAVKALGLRMVTEKKLKEIVDRIVRDYEDLILERKGSALGPLMGIIMKRLRGKADAQKISKLLKKGIEETLNR